MDVPMLAVVLVVVVSLGCMAAMAWAVGKWSDNAQKARETDAELLKQWSSHVFALKAPEIAAAEIQANANVTTLQRERLAWERERTAQLQRRHTTAGVNEVLKREAGIVNGRMQGDGGEQE